MCACLPLPPIPCLSRCRSKMNCSSFFFLYFCFAEERHGESAVRKKKHTHRHTDAEICVFLLKFGLLVLALPFHFCFP